MPAITAPLGERVHEIIAFKGSVIDSDGVDHFRIVDGDRLMWESPETTWAARPQRFAGAVSARIRTIFPQLGNVEITETFGGATGQTVHGMPQIGQLRKGLWVASGFGRQGMNTSAMAGQLIARSILWGDERWRLFSPFELVWAGGPTGRVAGQLVGIWGRASSAAAGVARPLPRAGAGQGQGIARRGWPKPTGPPARVRAVRRPASGPRLAQPPQAAVRSEERGTASRRTQVASRNKLRKIPTGSVTSAVGAPYLRA